MSASTTSPVRFDGRVVIITGAGRGLGAAYAKLLAARGAKVVVNDLGSAVDGSGSDRTQAESVVEEIRAAGGEAVADASDIADPDGGFRVVASALNAFGRIDGVITNAGIYSEENIYTVDADAINRHLSVHLFGSLNVVKPAWPHLVESRGSVVLTLSAAMLGASDFMAYSIGKAATFGLMRNLAATGSADGVRVNAVMPAADTRMQSSNPSAQLSPERVAVSGLSTPAKAAPAVCYLVHSDCPATGEVFATGRGWIKRLAIGLTEGFGDANMSLEGVAAHFDEATALTTIHEVPTAPVFSARLYADSYALLAALTAAKTS